MSINPSVNMKLLNTKLEINLVIMEEDVGGVEEGIGMDLDTGREDSILMVKDIIFLVIIITGNIIRMMIKIKTEIKGTIDEFNRDKPKYNRKQTYIINLFIF